jgi:isopenicillin N synthase-like dioxygenase
MSGPALSRAIARVDVVDVAAALHATGTPAEKHSVAAELLASFRRTGFAVITGHQVPAELFATMSEASEAFFALPQEEKLAVAFPAPEILRGYEAPDPEDDPEAPRLESFIVNRPVQPADHPEGSAEYRLWRWPNVWPERPEQLRPVCEHYYREMEQLGDRLLELVASGLGLPATWFASSFDRHFSNLVANNYPPRPATRDARPRNRPHTDHGVLTLLYRPDEPGGLEVQAQGRWWRVPFLAGSLVLNVGDLLERWTGGILRATPHRVVTPAGAAAMVRRQSVVYFQQPNPDALVEPAPDLRGVPAGLRYRPVRAGVHISRKELGHQAVAALGVRPAG